jgi:hypothetical protein
MSRSRILIVTDVLDAHVDRLMRLLRTEGQDPVRLNASDLPARTAMSYAMDGSDWTGTLTIHLNGRQIDVAALRSVWWRKPGSYVFGDELTGDQERAFAVEETDHAMRGLWSSLDCYWISHPENIRRAGYKMEQLQRAARLGFEVPRTLVTTDPAAAREFYERCGGQVVYKVLSDPHLALSKRPAEGWSTPVVSRFVDTTPITAAEVAMLDAVRSVPCQFQEYVPKRTELRVTVIGDEVFTAEILSQQHARSSVDWRRFQADVTFRRGELPDDVAKRCLELTRSYGLNFGAVDLILTPDGRYVFLEINPNGQFLFVQDRLPELPLGEALVACLIRGGN